MKITTTNFFSLQKWLSRLQVSQKLALGYTVALGVAIIGTTTGIVLGEYYERQAKNLLHDAHEEFLHLHELQVNLLNAGNHQKQLANLVGMPEIFEEEYAEFQEYQEKIQQNWAALEASYTNTEVAETSQEQELFQKLLKKHDQAVEPFFQELDELVQKIELSQDLEKIDANHHLLGDFSASFTVAQFHDFAEEVEQLMAVINQEVEEAQENLNYFGLLRLQIIIISMLLSVLCAIIFGIYISRAITQPLQKVTQVAKLVTQESNFALRAEVTTFDEIGVLAATLNQLIQWIGVQNQESQLARQTLEQQTQELKAVINNLGDGLLVTDINGRIIRWNPTLIEMFDLTNTETLQNKTCQELFGNDFAQLVAKNQTQPEQVATTEVSLSANRIGHALATPLLAKSPVHNEPVCLGSVVLIRDITAEKEVDRMKTEFISTVSHELRTPLTSVLGFAKLIRKKLESAILPRLNHEEKKTTRAVVQVRNNLDIIITEGERLTSLINDVLDLAKIEAGKVEWRMQPLIVAEIIDQAIAATSVLRERKSLPLNKQITPHLPTIQGDRDRLVQVLINLLSNAIKFTEAGSITCRAQLADQEIIISIIDTGLGLTQGDQKRVFEKFKQVGDTLTDKPKGTGLGLPICKQIIEHHGGRIWVESQLNQGCNFSFSVPISTETTPEVQTTNLQSLISQLKVSVQRTSRPDDRTQRTILVVDDDASIRSLLRQELEAESYLVQEAQDGLEALQKLQNLKPDLIILDVMMPNLSGFDVAAVVKNDPQTMHIPTIILSIIEDRDRGYRLGIDRYFTKPINLEALLKEIEMLICAKTSPKQVLILDEQESTRTLLSEVLTTRGYTVTQATKSDECITKAVAMQPDMIIIDAAFSGHQQLVQTLRFDKGLSNAFFILLEHEQSNSSLENHDFTNS